MIEHEAIVHAVLLADAPNTFVTRRVGEVKIELGGIPGDRHYGLQHPAGPRQKLYPRGVMVANRRQISIVSLEECERIADHMGIPELKPEWLGANLMISGFARLTQLPLGARLIFDNGTGLICEGENLPCQGPADVIGQMCGEAGLSTKFIPAAKKLRGIVCSVEREGVVRVGEGVKIFL